MLRFITQLSFDEAFKKMMTSKDRPYMIRLHQLGGREQIVLEEVRYIIKKINLNTGKPYIADHRKLSFGGWDTVPVMLNYRDLLASDYIDVDEWDIYATREELTKASLAALTNEIAESEQYVMDEPITVKRKLPVVSVSLVDERQTTVTEKQVPYGDGYDPTVVPEHSYNSLAGKTLVGKANSDSDDTGSKPGKIQFKTVSLEGRTKKGAGDKQVGASNMMEYDERLFGVSLMGDMG